jgi:hypothetical protein
MRYLLADPGLTVRTAGEELTRAVAGAPPGQDVVVRLRASLPTTFPLAQTRPRYTVRDLLKVADPLDPPWYVHESPGGEAPPLPGPPGLDYASTHESRLIPVLRQATLTDLVVTVPVPAALAREPALLAAFVDHRLIVRLGTVENQVLLHGSADQHIQGLLTLDGLRHAKSAGNLADDLAAVATDVEEAGGSCDGIVAHPRVYWQLVSTGLLERLTAAGVRVSRTRMISPDQMLFGDFRAAVTLLDPAESALALRRADDPARTHVLEARASIGLAVHLPQHFVLLTS